MCCTCEHARESDAGNIPHELWRELRALLGIGIPVEHGSLDIRSYRIGQEDEQPRVSHLRKTGAAGSDEESDGHEDEHCTQHREAHAPIMERHHGYRQHDGAPGDDTGQEEEVLVIGNEALVILHQPPAAAPQHSSLLLSLLVLQLGEALLLLLGVLAGVPEPVQITRQEDDGTAADEDTEDDNGAEVGDHVARREVSQNGAHRHAPPAQRLQI